LSSEYREEINNRFDDIVSRLDAAQRAEASITQKLNVLIEHIVDLKRRQREGRV